MKEKDFKNLLLTIFKEKDNINNLLSSQSPDDINNNTIKIPTTIIENKIPDILKSKDNLSTMVKNLNINFEKDSLILDILVFPSKFVGQVNISFFVKIKEILISKNNIKAFFSIHEYPNKNMPVIKKLAISTFTKNRSIIETVLSKSSLSNNITYTFEKNSLTFFVSSPLLQHFSDLGLKFKNSDKNFFYFEFKTLNDKNTKCKTSKKTNIKTGSISSMLNYSDRF